MELWKETDEDYTLVKQTGDRVSVTKNRKNVGRTNTRNGISKARIPIVKFRVYLHFKA